MELTHSFSVPVGVEVAWAAFNDVELVASCFPGAAITSVDGDEFTGTAKIKLGPISLQYGGKGIWLERDSHHHRAVMKASGKDKRGGGTAAATIVAQLKPDGDDTLVVVDTELNITGRPAQFGRGVIVDVSNNLLGTFIVALRARLAGDEAEPVPAPAAPAVRDGSSAGTGTPAPSSKTGVPVAVPVPTATATPTPTPTTASDEASIDLGAVLGPVLLRRFGPALVSSVVTGVIVWLFARRRH